MKINEFKLKVWGLAEYNFESQVGMNFQKMVKNRILICEKCCADRFTYSFGKICGNDGLLWYIKKSCIMEDVLYVIYCEPQKG